MDRVGDIPLMKSLVRRTRANVITVEKQKLLDAATVISQALKMRKHHSWLGSSYNAHCPTATLAMLRRGNAETAILRW